MTHDLFSAISGFEPSPILAVAVSGGADSMALLLLTQAWAKENNGKVVALTVDHGLRAESAQEAAQVQEWCRQRGIEHHVLSLSLRERMPSAARRVRALPVAPPSSGASRLLPEGEGKITQAVARQARYKLLTDWCRAHGVAHLLAGHHQGDQAETLFFRLARGSGIDGLACMPVVSMMHGIRLIRPLLTLPKSDLEAMLKAAGQPWINDPSNNNPKYTRNRIRAAINDCDNPEDISRRAAGLAQRFGHIRAIMERELARLLPQAVDFRSDGAFLHLEAFLQLPPVYGIKALSKLAQAFGNRPYPPRSEKLMRLYDDIVHYRIRKQRSFAGLLFTVRQNGLLIRPEPKVLEKSDTAPHIG